MNKVVSNDGTTIAFDRSGEGPPLILVDGALCSRKFGPMPGLVPLLAPHFTVFSYDRRGRGESGDTEPYAVEREVEDIEALIKEAGGSSFAFGISSGGALALEAAGSGLGITKLAMYEPPFFEGNGHRPPADHQARLIEFVSSGRLGDAVDYFMTQMVGLPDEAVAPMKSMPAWSDLEAVAHTLVYDSAIMGDYSLPAERVASVRIPTLVAAGDQTDPRLRHSAQALANTLPDPQHRSLKDQTHEVAPDALAPVLVEFFTG